MLVKFTFLNILTHFCHFVNPFWNIFSRLCIYYTMELTFLELRTKEVVNTQDGRKLGKVCDIALCYPDNRWLGIIVPGSRGFGIKRNNLFIDLRNIVKIGEDVILVNIGLPHKNGGKKGPSFASSPPPPSGYNGLPSNNRNFDEYE